MYLMDTNMRRPRVRRCRRLLPQYNIQYGSNARNEPFKSFLIKSQTELNRWERVHHIQNVSFYVDCVCMWLWFIILSDEIHKFLLFNFQFKVLKIYKDVIEDTIQFDDPTEKKRKNKKINYLHIDKQRLWLLLWLSTTSSNSNTSKVLYLYLQVEAEATDTFLSQSHMPYILYLMSL